MLSKFANSVVDNCWAPFTRDCKWDLRWSAGTMVMAGALMYMSLRQKGDPYKEQISLKQKSREVNRDKLLSLFMQDGKLMSPERCLIVSLDLPELRARLQAGELTCVQVLEAFQAKALEVDEKTNSVVEFLKDALPRAMFLDSLPMEQRRPLHGIPISLKEHINIKGLDTTVGIPSNLGILSAMDSGIVSVLKHLGANPFCRTNLPQSNLSYDCSNPIFGVTLNPRDVTRSPGGSSGGEGALIAAGGSVIGFGSDLGGSVRIPAMFCGITSLKPTCGRIPLSGQGSDGGMVGAVGLCNTIGIMGRSARGISECFKEIVNEPSIEDLALDPRLVSLPWREAVAKQDQKLKIGWYSYDGCLVATPGCCRAVQEAVQMLREKGHEVVPFCPPGLSQIIELCGQFGSIQFDPSIRAMLQSGAQVDEQALAGFKRLWRIPMCLKTLVSSLAGWYLNSTRLAGAILAPLAARESWKLLELNAKRLALTEAVVGEWRSQNIDVVIAPGMAMPALKLGYPGWLITAITYTYVYNLLNFPAGSVPVSSENVADQAQLSGYPGKETDIVYEWIKDGIKGAEGMPLNVQVIGLPWKEELVLRVMEELQEKVKPSLLL